MRWQFYNDVKGRDDPYGRFTQLSDAGYAVMQCIVDGVPVQRFVAFRVVPGSSTRQVLGGYGSLEEARQICEAHAAQSREIA